MKKYLLFILFFCMAVTQSIATITLTFDDLADEGKISSAQGSQVTMRGFLYAKEEGVWILAATPNLKSCCLGKAKQQVMVPGDFADVSNQAVVELEGMFSYEPPFYRINNASLAHSQESGFPLVTILAVCLVFCGIGFSLRLGTRYFKS